ncbi:MAG: hypothetical protein LBU70_10325 [Chitinispirillales bacterium]|jgi:hypothetical protein|nr:hypothetical protein [Chitinispirillales bacterium]
MLKVSEGVQCTPCCLIERGNFEPLSPKKDFDFKDFKGFDFNVEINYRRVNIGVKMLKSKPKPPYRLVLTLALHPTVGF